MKRYGSIHLVVIAIDTYKELTPLKAPVHDAESLADVLSEAYGLERSRIGRLYNEEATNWNIMQLLRSLKMLPAEDTLIIYYAGHGKTDDFDQMNFWLPYDAGADTAERVRWLPSHTVIGAMRRSGAQHVLLLNDSCFSGDFVGTNRDLQEKREGYRETAEKYSAREVITSGMSEVVTDSGMDGHSPFAWHLLNGLKNHGEAWVDTDELYEYVKRGVTGQRPLHRVLPEAGHQDGGLVLLYRQGGPSAGNRKNPSADWGRAEGSETAGGVAAAPNREEESAVQVYKCPICGLRNREEETFECKVCGLDYLCRDHFDKEMLCCKECAEKQRKEAEQKAEAKRKKEQAQREKAKREEELRKAAIKKLETGLVPMKYVEGGSFQMGSEDEDAYSNEQPVHLVQVESFYMGIYPVTQEQYQEVMGKNPSYFDSERDFGKRPVEQVSWYDAVKFCNALSRREGREEAYTIKGKRISCVWKRNGYRLPTEAEREYAARGGVKSRGYTYAGSNNPDEVAWYDDNAGAETRAVEEKRPNELGLYDMSGNVYEWCWDCFEFDGDYYKQSPAVNPRGPASGSRRVRRGGGWFSDARRVRAAYRDYFAPSGRDSGGGFRVLVPAV